MKILYDDCLKAIRHNKCSECTEFYQCSVCDYIQQRYQQGRVDERKAILGMVNYKVTEDVIRREFNIKIDAIKGLNDEQIIQVILEQLKEQKC